MELEMEDDRDVLRAWDDVSGLALDPNEVKLARKKEIEFFRERGVYKKVPVEECWKVTGKAPVTVRWIDINKGDAKNPQYRSRLVAREIKRDNRPDLFAATPPLEAMRSIISIAATKFKRNKNQKLMLCDISRAYFYVGVRRRVFVQLCAEDQLEGEEGMCGELEMCDVHTIVRVRVSCTNRWMISRESGVSGRASGRRLARDDQRGPPCLPCARAR